MLSESVLAAQAKLLAGVSRSFAFTIPQLPESLRHAVGNAYLLCRLADMIEDDPGLSLSQKQHFFECLPAVVADTEDPESFGRELGAGLSPATGVGERELASNVAQVMYINRALPDSQRRSLARCVEIMTRGMMEFQTQRSLSGLADLPQLERYCYCVAGVFGEMLTELFCDYNPRIDQRRDALMPLAVSYGQGLQMTNILKDLWEDRSRGVCWLPRDIFQAAGVSLERLPECREPGFAIALNQMLGIARNHLDDALQYTLLLPAAETGIRRYIVSGRPAWRC